MNTLPAPDLRSNLGTWAVPACLAPAVARVMLAGYAPEPFDPGFQGQELETYYFDTEDFALRKARRRKGPYLTLRVRRYKPSNVYAFSAKTPTQKFRVPLPEGKARDLLESGAPAGALRALLPADLLARLHDLAGEEPLTITACVEARRYAVEDGRDRLTLDLGVRTDTGLCLPAGVLEFKSIRPDAPPPGELADLELRPIKLSKFLWATGFGGK
jgi:hypothetical protein